ncbi:NAD-binding protein [Fomitiporia mediterranea MF3/22]|uniref:NAD-binding protein n=1 Tax=Fomitiporia mediterranea (strain MF3/22) TaxID=694068 RepID=UPI0004408073|nr:NAD-binding protein [Fomitiporia mediterranea MF3/22]EJD07555.1 NAD-binding protein [Fomitiporia mediterranea MF3/22]
MDVNDKQSIKEIVRHIEEADGKLDVLVNNAGVSGPGFHGKWPVEPGSVPDNQTLAAYGEQLFNQTSDEWDTVARTDVMSVFFVTMAFLGLLGKSTEGREGRTASVINITSIFAHTKLNWGYYAYDSFKAASSHLTRLLATDMSLKRAPIRVNAIAPGPFMSEFSPSAEWLQSLVETDFFGSGKPHPMKRIGREEEMVSLAVYLASDVSEYVTGQEITIDGGISLVNP